MHRPHINGWRGAGLLFIGLTCLARAYRYICAVPANLGAGVQALTVGGTLIHVVGWMWLIAGACGCWSAWHGRHDLIGVGALAFMYLFWAVGLAIGYLQLGGDWVPIVVNLGTFGLIVCWSRMVNPPRADVELVLSNRGASE